MFLETLLEVEDYSVGNFAIYDDFLWIKVDYGCVCVDKQLLDMLDQQMSSSSFEPFNEEHFTLEDLEEYLQAYNEEDDADYLPGKYTPIERSSQREE